MLFSVKGIFKVTCKLVSFYSSKYAVLERRSIIEFDTYLIYSLIHKLTFFDPSMCRKYSIIPFRIDYRRFKIGLVHKYTRGMKEIRSLICIYYNLIQKSMCISSQFTTLTTITLKIELRFQLKVIYEGWAKQYTPLISISTSQLSGNYLPLFLMLNIRWNCFDTVTASFL